LATGAYNSRSIVITPEVQHLPDLIQFVQLISMADVLAMPDVLQDILDTIVSAHSSSATRSEALLDLEQLTARTFASSNNVEALTIFRSLQDTFECNVPSRVLSWMSNAVARLETLVNRGLSESERQTEAFTISSQLTRALSVIQAPPLSPSPFIKEMKIRDRLYGANRDASTGSDDSYSSQSSSNSFRSTSSTLTSASSVSASSSRAPSTSDPAIPKTPPQSPMQPDAQPSGRQRSLLMLRKDVDFVPVTPKKVQVARLGLGHSRLSSIDTPGRRPVNPPADRNVGEETPAPGTRDTRMPSHAMSDDPRGAGIKSTEQKKEFLGKMMGNVDTLVEGVEKAGIWGLG
ncbi:hypothetical protein EWM64_g2835, partial [Hericium alpestre]